MHSTRASVLFALLLGIAIGYSARTLVGILDQQAQDLRPIGAVAQFREVTTGLVFSGRVDTGAAVTSIHCPPSAYAIDDGSIDGAENVGKRITLRISGDDQREAEITTRIDGYVGVRNADHTEYRYQVRLRLSSGGIERDAVVTLNDRSSMQYKLLVGRSFLDGAFVVDVSRDNDGSR